MTQWMMAPRHPSTIPKAGLNGGNCPSGAAYLAFEMRCQG